MNYATKNKSGSGGLISVAVLLMFAWLCMRSCQTASVRNQSLNIELTKQSDSNKTLQKQVDSVAIQNKIVSDAAAAIARTNKAQQIAIDSLQQADPQPVISDEQTKAGQKLSQDISYLKTDVQMLAAQRDSLIALNISLKKKADSVYHRIMYVSKADTGKPAQKLFTAFDAPYFLGKRGDENQLPRLQINANIQLAHNWLLNSYSLGIGTNIYIKHLRIYNAVYYTLPRRQIGATSSAGYDFFNLYKSKK